MHRSGDDRSAFGKRIFFALFLLFVLLAVILVFILQPRYHLSEAEASNKTKVTETHDGQVYLYDGFDWIWMTPVDGVPVNSITEEDISWDGSMPSYCGKNYTSIRVIDVSDHQGEIDWKKVRDSGIDGVIIRAGRRGYTKGGLTEDPRFDSNMKGALEAGLRVGVYFFSQAINVQEAIEEAEMTLRMVGPYKDQLTLPVYFDWEKIYEYDSEPRTAGLDVNILSDCAVAFCETIRQGGCEPGVYFSRHTGYYGFDFTRLKDCHKWFALPEAKFPSFYYKVDAWQYSFEETVPGIDTPTDANLFFCPLE